MFICETVDKKDVLVVSEHDKEESDFLLEFILHEAFILHEVYIILSLYYMKWLLQEL